MKKSESNFLEQIKNALESYLPPFQRQIILLTAKGIKGVGNKDLNCAVEKLGKLFDGCKVSFRNRVLVAYIDTVLLPLEKGMQNVINKKTCKERQNGFCKPGKKSKQ